MRYRFSIFSTYDVTVIKYFSYIANFATRGSENTFVQIEDLQSGKYLSAIAGGTENALAIALPSTFFNNHGDTFALRAPLFILPIFTNTGAATLQLVCASRVMGTFPIVKGVNTPLAAGDIVKDSPLVVVFSTALSCFSMVNPVNGLFDMARFLEKAQNLADLVDKGAARNNLGLGKLALEDDYPKGSLSQKGIVQLSSATDSDSETMAATPKAVKAAMDLAASPSVKSVNGKKGEVRLTPDDIGAFAKTGGTVNGVVIVEGNKLVLKGDDRKHLGFHNQDGRARMWLYKDKGGDGVHLNNGDEGAGDWVFNKNGHFYSPQALHAAGATYQEDGNVHGAVWGGHLSGWVEKRIRESSACWVNGDNWWHKDFRAGIEFITQGGFVEGGDTGFQRVNLHARVSNRLLHVSIITLNFGQGNTTWNYQIQGLSGEREGFNWFHGLDERKMYWCAIGY